MVLALLSEPNSGPVAILQNLLFNPGEAAKRIRARIRQRCWCSKKTLADKDP